MWHMSISEFWGRPIIACTLPYAPPSMAQHGQANDIRTDECAYGIIGRGIWYFVHHTPIHLWGGGPRWGYWAARVKRSGAKSLSGGRGGYQYLKGDGGWCSWPVGKTSRINRMGHRNCSNIKLEHVGIYAAKHEEGLSLPWQLVLFLSSLVADDKNHQTFPAECRSLSGIETNPFRSS